MLRNIQMKDFMSTKPATVKVDTSLHDAVQLLLEQKISGATVVDEDNRVVGVISEMDLLKALEQMSYYNQGDGKVKDYMTSDVITVEDNMNIYDVAKKLSELKIRRLPVVKDGKFVGVISSRSILRVMKDSMDSNK